MCKKFLLLLLLSTININVIYSLNIKSMNFNLNKNSLWISYPLKSDSYKLIGEKIPKSHKIEKCKIFEEDNLDYRIFYNFFQVKTPLFSGNRLEIVTLGKNKFNNETSFIVIDCYSDTISWDPLVGIQKANCKVNKYDTNS